MKYRTLTGTGISVSNLALGTMGFGSETAENDAFGILDRSIEAGGNLVDTANVYGAGASEEVLGRWFTNRPADVTERVVLATKARFGTGPDTNEAGSSRRNLDRALNASLRRLARENVDLYQLHGWDPLTPIEETLTFLDAAVRAGKIHYIGLSNFTAWQMQLTLDTAKAMSLQHDTYAPAGSRANEQASHTSHSRINFGLTLVGSPSMDMLTGEQIAGANLTDWRKLAQGLHARYLVDDFGAGARFVVAVGEAGDALGHHPRVSIGNGYVDLKLITDGAIYRDGEGTEHVVEWVTQQDVDLARRITEIAADYKVDADPASVSVIELGLDTARSATIAPVWAALLTGNAEAQGHGSPSDEIRDATGRVPNLWFGDAGEHETARQRFHIEVYVAPEVAEQRIAAALAAGGTVVDDSNAPSLTVIADQDGNKGIVCIDLSAAKKD